MWHTAFKFKIIFIFICVINCVVLYYVLLFISCPVSSNTFIRPGRLLVLDSSFFSDFFFIFFNTIFISWLAYIVILFCCFMFFGFRMLWTGLRIVLFIKLNGDCCRTISFPLNEFLNCIALNCIALEYYLFISSWLVVAVQLDRMRVGSVQGRGYK